MRIKAFRALLPPAEIAHLVASVPYDTVNTEEARMLATDNPKSFLRIVRPEIELPDASGVYSDKVYAKALEKFKEFQENNILVRENKPCAYVYRQRMGNHVQRGVVVCCHIEDYENNLIRRHELTRKDKEDERARHIKTLNANTGPVFLAYRDDAAINNIVASTEKQDPLFDFTAPDSISHTVWRIPDNEELIEAFGKIPMCYVADGHHRTAAAAKIGAEKRAANPKHTGDEEYNWFLTVLFPASQLQILPYNRCVSDLNGMTADELINKIKDHFSLRENAEPKPSGPGRISMYLSGKWHELSWNTGSARDPVSTLDVSALQDRLLAPILGITDPRSDERIEFIGGIRQTDELIKRVDSEQTAVAFSMYPVTMEQIMVIADADRIMPPKSTWFEPKLRSGLLIHTLE